MAEENNLVAVLLKAEEEGKMDYEEATRILMKELARIGNERWSSLEGKCEEERFGGEWDVRTT